MSGFVWDLWVLGIAGTIALVILAGRAIRRYQHRRWMRWRSEGDGRWM